jgi:hypothetical protein
VEKNAMPVRSFIAPGAFGPEVIAAMSEAFEAACELHDVGQYEIVREVIAGRIICSGNFWWARSGSLAGGCVAGRQVSEARLPHSRQKSLNRFGASAV